MSEPQRQINPWIVAIAVMFATFMEVLDTTVVNVSLPHIAGSLSATIDEATWALTSYLVANAIVLPMTGWLASRFGRKNLLLLSVSGFTISSFLCELALGLLHQHSGRDHVADHDADVHLRSAVHPPAIAAHRLLGHRAARGRHR